MKDKKNVKIPDIFKKFAEKDSEVDWVVIGVICYVSSPKKSKKEKWYLNWRITDLKENFIYVNIFDKAYNYFYSLPIGTVVAILNPSVWRNTEGKSANISLSMNDPDLIKNVGVSRDLSFCNYQVKPNSICKLPINANRRCCEAHLLASLRQSQASRMQVNSV